MEPAAEFIAFTDLEAFTDTPPAPFPERPQALFVGVLERYKNIDGIAAAWRLVAEQLPDARLRLVGQGHRRDVVDELVAAYPETVSWTPSLTPEEVAAAIDESSVLLLPSRAEGTPRILLEAFCRGRTVVGGRVGGVPDVLEDDVSGLLVDPEDIQGIAAAIVRVLGDPALAERMGRAARERVDAFLFTPDEFAERTAELVEKAVAGR